MVTITYHHDGATHRTEDPTVLHQLVADKKILFWLDLEEPTEEESKLLSEVFNFHPIAVEDALNTHQRAKIDEFDDFFFLTAHELGLNERALSQGATDPEEIVTARQLSVFMGANFLVTVHTKPVEVLRELRGRCDQQNRTLQSGADYLLYQLLDAMVDGYFPLLDRLDDKVDDLEDRILTRPSRDILPTIFTYKRVLNFLRKKVGPLREVMQSLTSRDFPGVRSKTMPYLRDVADHLFRVYESLDNLRDIMSSMLDAYLSQVSNEMNRVMQKLSVVATVFIPITFITGVFGMNFKDQPWFATSFWMWMLFMAAFGIATYIWFKRRQWV